MDSEAEAEAEEAEVEEAEAEDEAEDEEEEEEEERRRRAKKKKKKKKSEEEEEENLRRSLCFAVSFVTTQKCFPPSRARAELAQSLPATWLAPQYFPPFHSHIFRPRHRPNV
jgi:cation transport ATPase